MLKKTVLFGCIIGLTLLVAVAGFGQNEVIVREKPLKARTLSGRVQLGDSPEGVKGVLVEECTSNWKIVKAATRTDENGHFNLPSASKNGIHYLRLSLHGANTLLIKVKIDRSGQKELSLVLSFST